MLKKVRVQSQDQNPREPESGPKPSPLCCLNRTSFISLRCQSCNRNLSQSQKLRTAWFQLPNVPDQAKLKWQKADQWFPGLSRERTLSAKGTRELSRSVEMPYIWFGTGYMTVCICQNKMMCTLIKCININACKLYLNKDDFLNISWISSNLA